MAGPLRPRPMRKAAQMNAYTDGWWQSDDGLRLHFRDYAGTRPDLPPVFCLPGLTRNARDFEKLAELLSSPAGGGWRVLCVELRGRGMSDYAPDSRSYNPMQYVLDVYALLAQHQIAKFVSIGTSLGGLLTMSLAALAGDKRPDVLAGALLNDIGPVLEPAGLDKIVDYVGKDARYPSWQAAADAARGLFGASFPGRSNASWLGYVHRTMVEDADGTVRYDYDPHIADPFKAGKTTPPDLWGGLDALAGRPVLLLRGALSDLLAPETFAEMQRRLPDADAVEVAGVGHVPALDEPEAAAAITRWLAKVAAA